MGKYAKYGCIGILVIFIFMIVVGIMTSFMVASRIGDRNEAQKVNETQDNLKKVSSKDKQKQSYEEYVCNVEGIGKVKGGYTSNVGIAICNIEQANVLGHNRFASAQAQGKFVVVSLVVGNAQSDAITVDANSFKLVTADGIEFSYSHEGQRALAVDNRENNSFLRKINPGIVIGLQIPFDIPAQENLDSLQLEARGGITGKPIRLPLKVQKVE